MADEESKDGEQEQKPSLIKKLMFPLVLSIVVAGGALGALNFMGIISFGSADQMVAEGEAAEGEEGDDDGATMDAAAGSPAYFFTLYPDMLVTLSGGSRTHYLKLTIDVMSRDEAVVAGVEQYHPIIRNNLLKLFQEVDYEIASSPEGVDTLQAMAVDEVKRVLKKYHGQSAIEGVYFTSFVVQ